MDTQGIGEALGAGFNFFGWLTVVGFFVLLSFAWDWLFADRQTARAALSLLFLVQGLSLLSGVASAITGYSWIRWLGCLMVVALIAAPLGWLYSVGAPHD